MAWSDEEVGRLTKDWEDGFSASQIGERLGRTKNSILGKVDRMGLPKRDHKACCRKGGLITSQNNRFRFGASPTPRQKRAPEVPQHPTPPVLTPHPENMPRVSLFETGMSKCKFPLWDGGDDHRDCCGLPTEGLGPYCTHHRRVTYHPIETRKKQRRAA